MLESRGIKAYNKKIKFHIQKTYVYRACNTI